MSVQRAYTGTKPPSNANQDQTEIPITTGIHKGTVKKIDYTSRSGKIFVYIPFFGGNDPDNPLYWTVVTYASPFGGQTLGQRASTLRAGTPSQANKFEATKQSYGWFTSPPDVGSVVLCCFPEGIKFEGFWFACVSSDLSRYMTPSIGSVPVSKIEESSVPANLKPLLKPNGYYPVSEFNENDKKVFKSDWNENLKPLHVPQTRILLKQGLDEDKERGAITSSMQRDPISTVYGFSTPGRPFGSQDPANDPNLQEKLRTGNFDPVDFQVTTRVGGHSLTMDDGDLYNKNNLVRLKTSGGHQILMNDSEGFIYISSASGNSWIELTPQGNMLVYAKGNMSVRTEGNFNVHSDKNINMFAKGRMNLVSENGIFLESKNIIIKGKEVLQAFAKKMQLIAGQMLNMNAGSSLIQRAQNKISLDARMIDLNGGGSGAITPAEPKDLTRVTSPDVVNNSGKWENNGSKSISSIFSGVPTHEPFKRSTSTAAASIPVSAPSAQVSPAQLGSNVQNAKNQAVDGAAPRTFFNQQPTAAGPIGALNETDLTAYMAQIGFTESTGKYNTVNSSGFVGKYQFGAAALYDLGYVTVKTNSELSNPNNWTGKNGINNLDLFLNSGTEQESAMYGYTKSNYNTLVQNRVITTETSKEDVSGFLAAAHKEGATGASQWATGQPGKYNVAAANRYFNLGRYSQTQIISIADSRR